MDSTVNETSGSNLSEEHQHLLHSACRGETLGEAMFVSLETSATNDRERQVCRLMAELEKVTAELLVPVMRRHGVDYDRAAAWTEGEECTARMIKDGWVSYFDAIIPLSEAGLAEMQRLHELSDEQDRPATARLVAHEVAFLEFAQREAAGDTDSTAPLERFLAGQTSAQHS